MKEPGLDNRHRDKAPPKAGEIQQKRGDTLNRESSGTDSAVLGQREARNHAGRNRQDECGGCAEGSQASTFLGWHGPSNTPDSCLNQGCRPRCILPQPR